MSKSKVYLETTVPSKAMADQLTTESKQRLLNKMGEITATELQAVDRAIQIHLDLLTCAWW